MSPRSAILTPRQWEVLRAVLRLEKQGGDSCLTASALAEDLGLARQNLRDHLLTLHGRGFLNYHARPRQVALLSLTPAARAALGAPAGFPLLGEVAAGLPALADGGVQERVTRLDDILPMREGDFLLRVRGESMLGLGIFPGDVVAIRPADVAQNGEVALVLIPGENAGTLKRWQQRGRAVTLHSENPAFEPMRFPVADVQVQGVLVGHIGLGGARRSARGRP